MKKEGAVVENLENQGDTLEASQVLEKQEAPMPIKETAAEVEQQKLPWYKKIKEAILGNPEVALRERTAITINSALKRKLISARPTEMELAAYYEAAKNDPDKPFKGRPTFKTGKLGYEQWKDVPVENELAGGGAGSTRGHGGV